MLKKSLLLGFMNLCLLNVFAQSKTGEKPEKPVRQHSIGVQANALTRQLFNFGNTNLPVNPYLVKYSYRPNVSKKFEFQTGVGYTNTNGEDNDGFKSNSNQFDIRVGAFKKFDLGSRFEAGLGMDVIYGSTSLKSINRTGVTIGQTGFDSTEVITSSTMDYYGTGPQLNLTYSISKKVTIGTETTLYFRRSKQKTSATINEVFNTGNPEASTTSKTDTENQSTKSGGTSLTSPVILFLIIKF